MEIYDALKAGTRKEDLLAQFQKELNEASAKLDKEKEDEARATRLADARYNLADAIISYTAALAEVDEDDVEDEFSFDDIQEILLDFEKQFSNLTESLPTLENFLASNSKKTSTKEKSDDEVLADFLKKLF